VCKEVKAQERKGDNDHPHPERGGDGRLIAILEDLADLVASDEVLYGHS
jgi:hypothetical protein